MLTALEEPEAFSQLRERFAAETDVAARDYAFARRWGTRFRGEGGVVNA